MECSKSAADRLPPELIELILLLLPDQNERIRCTTVSKQWFSVRGTYESGGRLWRRLRSISVRTGGYVDRITFSYTDGSELSVGGGGGRPCPPFCLARGDELAGLEIRSGDALDSVVFVTRLGHRSQRYGGTGGDFGLKVTSTASAILGFSGTVSDRAPWCNRRGRFDSAAGAGATPYLVSITQLLDCKGRVFYDGVEASRGDVRGMGRGMAGEPFDLLENLLQLS